MTIPAALDAAGSDGIAVGIRQIHEHLLISIQGGQCTSVERPCRQPSFSGGGSGVPGSSGHWSLSSTMPSPSLSSAVREATGRAGGAAGRHVAKASNPTQAVIAPVALIVLGAKPRSRQDQYSRSRDCRNNRQHGAIHQEDRACENDDPRQARSQPPSTKATRCDRRDHRGDVDQRCVAYEGLHRRIPPNSKTYSRASGRSCRRVCS